MSDWVAHAKSFAGRNTAETGKNPIIVKQKNTKGDTIRRGGEARKNSDLRIERK